MTVEQTKPGDPKAPEAGQGKKPAWQQPPPAMVVHPTEAMAKRVSRRHLQPNPKKSDAVDYQIIHCPHCRSMASRRIGGEQKTPDGRKYFRRFCDECHRKFKELPRPMEAN